MPGTTEGAKKANKTIKERYGDDFHATIGRKGGQRTTADGAKPKGFAANPALAKLAGQKGGKLGKRGPAKKD